MSIVSSSHDIEDLLQPIDHAIDTLYRRAEQQQATIKQLTAEGHEVTDARRELIRMLESLEALLRVMAERAASGRR